MVHHYEYSTYKNLHKVRSCLRAMLAKALYDNAFCQHDPWSRVLGTQYPCSRAVFPWTRVLFRTLVNTAGVNACDTLVTNTAIFDTLPATRVVCIELKAQTVLSLQVVKASFVLPSCYSDNSRLWNDLGRTLKRSIRSVHFDTGVRKMPVHPSTRTVFTVVRVHGFSAHTTDVHGPCPREPLHTSREHGP